jgi:EpsD family peptidyl-prolyl cis-trans isomerase
MIHSVTNARRIFAGSAAAFLLLTASCNKAAPKGQVIAVANGEEITIGELNEEAKARGLSIGNDPAARASAVQDLVSRKLLAQEARRRQLDRRPDYLLAQRRLSELLLVRDLVGTSPGGGSPTDAEVAAFINANPFAFDRRAQLHVAQVAAPGSFQNALGAAQSLDDVQALLAKAKVASQRSEQVLDSAQLPQNTVVRLLTSKGALVLLPQDGQVLALQLLSVTPQPVPPEQRLATAREWMTQRRSDSALQGLVDQLRSKAKIQYQPGFGPSE